MKANQSLAASANLGSTGGIKNSSAVTASSIPNSSQVYQQNNKLLISQLQESVGKYQSEYFQKQLEKIQGTSEDDKQKKVQFDQARQIAETSLSTTNRKFAQSIRQSDVEVIDDPVKKVMPLAEQLLLDKKEQKVRKEHNRLKLQLKQTKNRLEEIQQESHRKQLHVVEEKELERQKEQILYKKALIKTKLQKVKEKMDSLQSQRNDHPRMTASHPVVRSFFLKEDNIKRDDAEKFIQQVHEKRKKEKTDLQERVRQRKEAQSLVLNSFKKEDLERKKQLNDEIEKRFKDKMMLLQTSAKKRLKELEEFQDQYLKERQAKDQKQWDERLAETMKKETDPYKKSYQYKNPDLLKQLPQMKPAFIRMKQEYYEQNKFEERLKVQTALADIRQSHPDIDAMYLQEHEQNYFATLKKLQEENRKKRENNMQRYFSPQSFPKIKYESTKWREDLEEWKSSPSHPNHRREEGQVTQAKRKIYGSAVWENTQALQKSQKQILKELQKEEERKLRTDKNLNPKQYVKPIRRKLPLDQYESQQEYQLRKPIDYNMIYHNEFIRESPLDEDQQKIGNMYLKQTQQEIENELIQNGKGDQIERIQESTARFIPEDKRLFTQKIREEKEKESLEQQFPQLTINSTKSLVLSESKMFPQEGIFTRPDYLKEMRFKLNLENTNKNSYKQSFNKILGDQNTPLFTRKSEIQTITQHMDKEIGLQQSVLRNSLSAPGLKEVENIEKINDMYLNSIDAKLKLLDAIPNQSNTVHQNASADKGAAAPAAGGATGGDKKATGGAGGATSGGAGNQPK